MIKETLLENFANRVILEENGVIYRGTTGHPTRSMFARIDGGSFMLMDKGGQFYLVYTYRVYRFLITMGIMGVVAGLIVRWWFGVTAFLWLAGVNWTINFVQHRKLVRRLATDIDIYFMTSLRQSS